MAEESPKNGNTAEEQPEAKPVPAGPVSKWLTENGFANDALDADNLGVELIQVDSEVLIPIATALYAYGFNYPAMSRGL